MSEPVEAHVFTGAGVRRCPVRFEDGKAIIDLGTLTKDDFTSIIVRCSPEDVSHD